MQGNEPISADNLKAVVSSLGGGVIHDTPFDLYGNNEKTLQKSIAGYDLIVVVFKNGSAVVAPSNDGYAYGHYESGAYSGTKYFTINGKTFSGDSSNSTITVQKIFGIKVKMN